MFFFKKKKKEGEDIPDENDSLEMDVPPSVQAAIKPTAELSLSADVARLKAEVEAFSDVRKATNERLTRISEQIGELRGMIADRDRTISQVEIKATKAADLVEAVHPDQLMIEVKREDAKIEALKAGIESNEILMKRVLDEIKDIRNKVSAFRGVDEIIQLNQEVKAELIEIKRVEVNTEKHSNKVETIFAEVQKRFIDVDKIDDSISANAKQISDIGKTLDSARIKAESAAPKKTTDELISKFNSMKTQLSDVITVLNRRFTEIEANNRKELDEFEDSIWKKAASMPSVSLPITAVRKDAITVQTQVAPVQQAPEDMSASPVSEESAPSVNSKPKSEEDEILMAAKYVDSIKKQIKRKPKKKGK